MSMFRFAAVAAVVLGSTALANAQPQLPVTQSRPVFSPYLNLLRNGGSPALNYFGIVRPEQQFAQQQFQFRQQLQQTNQAVQAVNQAVIAGGDPNIPETGHAAVFNNTLHYFGGQPGASGGGGGSNFQSAGRSLPKPGTANPGRYGGTAGNGIPRR
ncbi:MAG TPA: hypothetical protein VGJ05_12815 [Fimbriiglobus sp.]|jgi:hypothetical protein